MHRTFIGAGIAAGAAMGSGFGRSTKDNVIVFAGPGGNAYNHGLINSATQAFLSQGLDVKQIGDGVSPITPAEMEQLKEAVKKGKQPLLMIIAQGQAPQKGADREPQYYTSENTTHDMTELLKTVTAARGDRPIDVVSAAGHEGLFARYAREYLPKGSMYITLSPFQNWYGSLADLFEQLNKTNYFHGAMSASKFLITYLALAKDIQRPNNEVQKIQLHSYEIAITRASLPMYSLNSINLPDWNGMENYAFGMDVDSRSQNILKKQMSRFVSEDVLDSLMKQQKKMTYETLPKQLYGVFYAMQFCKWTAERPDLRATFEMYDKPERVARVDAHL